MLRKRATAGEEARQRAEAAATLRRIILREVSCQVGVDGVGLLEEDPLGRGLLSGGQLLMVLVLVLMALATLRRIILIEASC